MQVTEVQTGISDKATTNASGDYTFPNLGVGIYTIQFSAPSFQMVDVEKLEIHVGTTVRQDATLSPAGVNTKGEVGATAPLPQSQESKTVTYVPKAVAGGPDRETQMVGGFWNDEWGLRIGGAYPNEGPGGATFTAVGHPDWVVLQPSVPFNSQEINIYGTAAQGQATSVAGTNRLIYVRGTTFTPEWIGLPYFYFGGQRYTVSGIGIDGTTLSVTNIDGSAVSFLGETTNDFHFVASTTETICNVNGDSVARVSGNPFMPFAGGDISATVRILGKVYDVSKATQSTLTITTLAGKHKAVTCYGYINVYDEITNLRVQKMWGADEENLAIMSRATGSYEIRSLIAGQGKYLPIYIGSGATGVHLYNQIVVHEDGSLSLGNDYGADTLRIQTSDGRRATHFLQVDETPNDRTRYPSIAARTNTSIQDIGLSLDTLGSGPTLFTSHSYGNTEFQILGRGGMNYLTVGSDSTSPTLSANGPSANANLKLAPKGTGMLISTAPVQLPSYIVGNLPECGANTRGAEVYASNARNSGEGSGAGTGSVVACDGAKWRIPGIATTVTY